MQSDEFNDEYKTKINEIIDFFMTEKEKGVNHFNFVEERKKFNFSIFLSLVAIEIALFSPLKDMSPLIGIIIPSVLLIFCFCYVVYDNLRSRKRNEVYIYESVSFETVIHFLQYLKISQTVVDLSPLIKKIELLHSDSRHDFMDYDNYRKIWRKEVIESLDIMKNQIND